MVGVDLRVTGVEKMRALAAEFKAAPKELQAQIRKSLREVTKPLGERARQKAADELPQSGGESANVSNAMKITSQVGLGVNPRMRMKATAESVAGAQFRKARSKARRAGRARQKKWRIANGQGTAADLKPRKARKPKGGI